MLLKYVKKILLGIIIFFLLKDIYCGVYFEWYYIKYYIVIMGVLNIKYWFVNDL